MYTAATRYLEKTHGFQSKEQHHRSFSNIVLSAKLREVVRFFYELETGGGWLQPDNLALDKTGIIHETVAYVQEGVNLHENNISCSTLEAYDELSISIPVYITEDVVKLVTWELSDNSIPGGTYSEALPEWI